MQELHRCRSRFDHEIVVAEEDGCIVMRFNGSKESAVDAANLLDSRQPYADMLHLTLAANPSASRTLIIGMGGGLLARRMWHDYPWMSIDAVEIDEEVIHVSRRFFGLPDDERLAVHCDCGRSFLERTSETYDIVIVDAYFDAGAAYSLMTREFASLAASKLRARGVLGYNMVGKIEGRGSRTLQRFVRGVADVLPQVHLFKTRPEFQGRQNVVVLGTAEKIADEVLRSRIVGRVGGLVSVDGFETFVDRLHDRPLCTRGVRPLLDAEAPADGVLQVL